MNKIVTFHSFRRGVGKTTLAANMAVLLALQGHRIALVDRNFQAPSAHLFFDIFDDEIRQTFNDYLWNRCDIISTVQDITFKLGAGIDGKLFFVAASTQNAEILYALRNPIDFNLYIKGFQELVEKLALDYILVDAPAGVNEDTLPSLAASNTLVVVLHPNKQDFQGTAVIVDIARQLQIPKIELVLNESPEMLDTVSAQYELEHTYQCGRGTILPHTKELMTLVSGSPFVLRYPQCLLTTRLKELVKLL